MGKKKSVLVTGSAGRLGQAATMELSNRGHLVKGFDRMPSPEPIGGTVANLDDLSSLQAAMKGVDVLLHLAATPDDVENPVSDLFPSNINSLYHVMEAALAAGVSRWILPSSGQVNWFRNFEGPWPLDEHTPVTPKGWYAATKMFLESIGYSYSVTHGTSVIVARLGWCPRDESQVREIANDTIYQDVYLSPGDAGRFFAGCVEADDSVKHAILYATSKPLSTQRYSLDRAYSVANYEPLEQWPDGTEVILGRRWQT